MVKSSFKAEHFINRELSWLEFNDRVLQESRKKNNPLAERIKFLSIVSSNLDEFFMIRVASLKDQIRAGYTKPDPAGLTPRRQLAGIAARAHKMASDQYSLLKRSVLPAVAGAGISLLPAGALAAAEKAFLAGYFRDIIYPVLTPMAVDSSRPFPLILNRSLNIGALVRHKKAKTTIFATVQVPAVLPRFIELPPAASPVRRFALLEDVIMMNIHRLFEGRQVICASPYRITKNADLSIAEDEADDLLMEIEKSLKKRKWGAAVRLEVDHEMDRRLVEILKNALELTDEEIYYISGPLDLTCLMQFNAITGMAGMPGLTFPVQTPQVPPELPENADIFETLGSRDIFLHHPYDSFEPVVDFVRKAANDPNVLAIKQTLYRVSGDSPIVAALTEAAEKGKQVTVLVELKARFDEEQNIHWARLLEQAGCHVIYGLVGFKTHCKIILVVRKEESGIKRYVHLGTGNYNDITARFYTDMGLLTCNEYFGADVSAVFNMLSGYSDPPELYKLDFAPVTLRNRFLELISRETGYALAGRPARMIAKMNSLVDRQIIEALYQASAAGVRISLIVRGICCLRPGIPGISSNITVHSIVGRYLEHSRVFYFHNDGREEVFLSSADWMPRNLDHRIELLFPLEDKAIGQRVIDILQLTLNDTSNTRLLFPNGKYKQVDRRGKTLFCSQDFFAAEARQKAEAHRFSRTTPVFRSLRPEEVFPAGEIAAAGPDGGKG